jgi:hypothetical protein
LLCFGIRRKPWLQQSIPIAWQSFKGWAVHFIHFTLLKIQVKIGGRRAVKAHLVDSERAASTYSYPIQMKSSKLRNKSEASLYQRKPFLQNKV